MDFPCNVLWCIGILPSSSPSKRATWVLNVYRAFVLFFLIAFTTLMTVQLYVATDLGSLARTMDIWTLFLSGTYKWLYMATFSEKFAKLNTRLVGIQTQATVVYGRTANQFTTDYLKRTRWITLLYLSTGITVVVINAANALITYPKSDRSEFDYFNDSKSYPLRIWIPFTIHEYWTYCAFFVSHCIVGFLITLIYLGIDSFMFSAIYAVAGQIDLLNLSIDTIEHFIDEYTNQDPICMDRITYYTEKQQKICYSMLRECLKHHILVHNYIKQISKDFSSLIIVDYLHGITSLTFALFQLSNSGGISESMAVVFFIFISGFHQFLNNIFGELIVQKQLSVGVTAYDVPWWRVDKKSRYLLTLMILRSNKPTLVTGLYMYKLCNNSFILFVKALYSYYMVLRHVNIEHKNA